jgi:hypothetical protein
MRLITLTSITGAGEDMFDEYVDTQTETADEISKTFSVAGFNALAILNCVGITATLSFSSAEPDITISLIRDSVIDWWDYFFAPTRTGGDFVFYFPTQPPGATATLTISYTGGTAKCGMCVTGVAKDIATTRQDITLGISDYSKISTDGFGRTYLNQGKWAKRVQAGAFVLNPSLDICFREVIKNRGVACIFDYNEYDDELETPHSSVDGFQTLIVYGFTEDFDIVTRGPSISDVRHESQGLR